MSVPRSQPAMSYPQRRALVRLLAFWSLLGFLMLGTTAQAHDHGHRHRAAAQSTSHHHADESAPDTATPADEEHGHHHSGDPLKDLLTLGHNHVCGASPGLPPALWVLAVAPHAAQPLVPWLERPLGESPPDNPFRPPIA